MSSTTPSSSRKSTWTVHPSQSQIISPLGIDTITFRPVDEYQNVEEDISSESIIPQPHSVICVPDKHFRIDQPPPQTPAQQPVPGLQPRQKHAQVSIATTTTTPCLASRELKATVASNAESSSAISEKETILRQGSTSVKVPSTSEGTKGKKGQGVKMERG